ncbi:MAG: glycosyl transferase [Flavobacteriales bacterium]|nr:MAG: glycosyl transferase [Flavobacteriales bacterium]
MSLKVSIITVCYNSSKTIEDTIQSVLSQTYTNIEYIIIDGLSTDNTLEIVTKYKDKITKIVSEKDNGLYDAINKGIKLATGDIIANLNSDDFYIDNNVIADVVEKIEKENTDSLYADLYYVDAIDTNKVVRHWKSGNYKHGLFYKGWMPPHPTFFVKKSVYEKYGTFNLQLKSAADYEIMLRFIHKYKIKISYLPRVVVRMRIGGVSNVSLLNRIKANREDKQAWLINDLKPKPYTLLFKPLSKLGQFLKKG